MSAPAEPKSADRRAPAEASPPEPIDVTPVKKGVAVHALVGVVAVVCVFGLLRLRPESAEGSSEARSAYDCPGGTAPSGERMRVAAAKLNVRAGPSPGHTRLDDRTLSKKATVVEECRAGPWSRVRLQDGRAGWVANEFLVLSKGSTPRS